MIPLRIIILALVAGSLTMLAVPPRAFAAPPGNDLFEDAIAVSAVPYSNTQLTDEATFTAPDEPLCGDIDATVWYAVTAPQAGTLKVTTQGSDFDTIIAAYSGTMLNSLQSLACNDDTGNGVASAVQFKDVVAGTTYYIQAGGFLGSSGQLTLNLAYGTPPANDGFGSAEVVPPESLPYTNSRDTIVATTELNEPSVPPEPAGCAPIGRTVWYTFTPAQTRLMQATTLNSVPPDFDTVLAVYTGDMLDDLTEIVCDDDTDFDTTSAVQFLATADTQYRIQVGGYLGDSGDLAFNLSVDNTSDTDGDGFIDENEIIYIGTGATDPCGNDGWPADLSGGDNTLNIGDFNSFLFPLRGDLSFNKFGHDVPDVDDANIERWNLLVDASINIGDLNALNPAVVAPTSRPPMFGGQPAFFTNGGLCPYPP